ncbi:MAG: ATP-dependent 6-phosphofructokinase [Alphaproteobacteria bacterium]|nr:ATP-dependent 6-phosphofructokinase [Alphaproteobacteria bacterium]
MTRKKMKRIAVLTTGGDCSGLNSVIRSVVISATELGIEVLGIRNASDGLLSDPYQYEVLSVKKFVNFPYERMGGTMLGTNSSSAGAAGSKNVDDKQKIKIFAKAVKALKIDGIVTVGGDGGTSIMAEYCTKAGVPMIAVPKTIDNDTPYTEQAVGFATAREICVEALDRLDTTAASHHRVMILEVMGRSAGHIALHTAIAGGADICLIPEVRYSYKGVIKKLESVRKAGGKHSLIVVAEGIKTEDGKPLVAQKGDGLRYAGAGDFLQERINSMTNAFVVRTTVLGHVQRGGTPYALDRLIATCFGAKAVQMLSEGKSYYMTTWQGNKVVPVPLDKVVKTSTSKVDIKGDFVKTALSLGMYIGDVKPVRC